MAMSYLSNSSWRKVSMKVRLSERRTPVKRCGREMETRQRRTTVEPRREMRLEVSKAVSWHCITTQFCQNGQITFKFQPIKHQISINAN